MDFQALTQSSHTAEKLKKLGITSTKELLTHFPRRYEDRRTAKSFLQIITNPEENFPVHITVIRHEHFQSRLGRTLKIIVTDGQTPAQLICFHREHLSKRLLPDKEYIIFGQFQYKYGEIQAHSFEFTPAEEATESLNFLRIVPIYALTEGLKQEKLRKIIHQALTQTRIPEPLPEAVTRKRALISHSDALWGIHFPKDQQSLTEAKRHIKYSEFLGLFLNIAWKRRTYQNKTHKKHYSQDPKLPKRLLESHPYTLTSDQEHALSEITADLFSQAPMYRILEGDVGTGKTLIALLTMLHAVESGYQATFMCPREILARQQHTRISEMLTGFSVRTILITSALKARRKKELAYLIRQGFYHIIIGTQSLFGEGIEYKDLGLVVIDEQHKFGVQDRRKLIQKGIMPDILLMTATPIPRTLALTVFGDLSISILKEKPISALPVKTYIIIGKEKREEVYRFVDKELTKGSQAFTVCPAIAEASEYQSAEKIFEELRKKLPHRKIAILHSKIPAAEQHRIMKLFHKKECELLIATSIIEVGIDIPNANIMVIENADYFGLPQLHQLRGRIGRGGRESFCFFCVEENLTENAKSRLKALKKHNDGFILAEEDLRLRGPGEFLGTKQSGLPEFKLADITYDKALLQEAREDAFTLIERDPQLKRAENAALKQYISPELLQGQDCDLRN